MRGISRRKFISLSAGAAALGALPSTLSRALAIPGTGVSMSSLRHVVVLMQENRSFDHYFGSLAGVRGFDDASALRLADGRTVFEQTNGFETVRPFRIAERGGACAPDLDHGWLGTHRAWNGGRYDDWIGAKTASTMGCLTREDLPFHYALADAFTICDHYFCSVMGPTNPNRLYLWSGTIDPDGRAGGPVIDNGPTGFHWTTYPERLQAAGVDWKVYQNASDNYDDNALAWFVQYQRAMPGTALFDRGIASVPAITGSTADDIVAALRKDALNGTLPTVSWIIAPESSSEHPAWSASAGAHFIHGVIDALSADPDVWASTALFINYDENDGYFDHVPPPVAPRGTPGEFVEGQPIGLGPRVPMIVVSPWSRGGFTCSQVFDHSSVIRFLETWLDVREPNISAWRRAICGDLTSAFDFASPVYSMPGLPATSAKTVGARACVVAPTPVDDASIPTQEPGMRPQRASAYLVDATHVIAESSLVIELANAATRRDAPWAHFTIHVHDDANAEPRRYDVAPGAAAQDVFAIADDGSYDIAVHGPNGLLRRFVAIADADRDVRQRGLAARVESANENAGSTPAL